MCLVWCGVMCLCCVCLCVLLCDVVVVVLIVASVLESMRRLLCGEKVTVSQEKDDICNRPQITHARNLSPLQLKSIQKQ